jgi:hypothetical protein
MSARYRLACMIAGRGLYPPVLTEIAARHGSWLPSPRASHPPGTLGATQPPPGLSGMRARRVRGQHARSRASPRTGRWRSGPGKHGFVPKDGAMRCPQGAAPSRRGLGCALDRNPPSGGHWPSPAEPLRPSASRLRAWPSPSCAAPRHGRLADGARVRRPADHAAMAAPPGRGMHVGFGLNRGAAQWSVAMCWPRASPEPPSVRRSLFGRTRSMPMPS